MSPLRRREELHALSEDHHNALVIALRCRRLAARQLELDKAEFWASVLDFVRLQVMPHFEVEEDCLLPALRDLGETAMADRIAHEHAVLRGLISDAPPSNEDLGRLGQLLDDHIRYEERVVFEEVQDRLPPDVLAEIRRRSLDVPQICPTTFRRLPR